MDVGGVEVERGNLEDGAGGVDPAVQDETRPLHGEYVEMVQQDLVIGGHAQYAAVPVAGFLYIADGDKDGADLRGNWIHSNPFGTREELRPVTRWTGRRQGRGGPGFFVPRPVAFKRGEEDD